MFYYLAVVFILRYSKRQTPLKRVILFVFPVLFSLLLHGQSPYFRHLTSKEGLPGSTVYSITQDSSGYIWMGTENGICRFDGVRFRKYSTPSDRSISANDLTYNGGSRIYFKNFSNQFFCLENDSIYEIPVPEEYGQLREIHLLSETELVLELDSLLLFDVESKKWGTIPLPGNYISAVDPARRSIFQSGPYGEFISYDLDGQKKQLNISTSGEGYNIIKTFEGIPYLLSHSRNEVDRMSEGKPQGVFPQLSSLLNGRMHNIGKDKENKYWILSITGAICFEDDATPYLNGLHFLDGIFTSDFLHDQEGNYWFTTIGNGVYVMYQDDALVYNKENSFLLNDQVKRIEVLENDELLIATNGDKAYHISAQAEVLTTFDTPMGDIESIYVDDQGDVYLESFLYSFDTPDKWEKYYAGNTPKNIVGMNADYLLVASGNGAFVKRKRSSKAEEWPEGCTPDEFNGFEVQDLHPGTLALRQVRSRDVHYDALNHTIWAGYIDGLYYYHRGKENKLSFPDGSIIATLDIEPASDNGFWVGTVNNGVIFIKNGNIQQHLTTDNGLISNYINVVKHEDHLLYLGTDMGLQVYDVASGASRVFNEQDGLPTNNITDIGLTAGTVWISTLSGLVALPKTFDGYNPFPPRVFLNRISVNGTTYDSDITRLAHWQNDISFGFTGIAFRSEAEFSYHYRLLGLDEEWTTVDGKLQEARFFSLPPNAYTFQVKATNEDGVESISIAQYSFTIAKPFWLTWWFLTLSILSLIAIISIIFIRRIIRIKREIKLEREIQSAQLDALKLQMNPHFLFNSLTAIQDYILQEKADMASHYVGIFSTLMREILENSRKEFVTIHAEVEMIKKYLELQQVRFDQKIDYEIILDPGIDIHYECIPPMFAQPFIENSIEHGLFKKAENKITIRFERHSNDQVSITIEDNGIGIDKHVKRESHHSLASTIVRERLALIQNITEEKMNLRMGNILDENAKITGFSVNFTLPIKVVVSDEYSFAG